MTYDEVVSCWQKEIGKEVADWPDWQRRRADHVLSHFPEVFECVIKTNNFDREQIILDTERWQKGESNGDIGDEYLKLKERLVKIAFDGRAPSLAPPVGKRASETGGRYGSNEHHKST